MSEANLSHILNKLKEIDIRASKLEQFKLEQAKLEQSRQCKPTFDSQKLANVKKRINRLYYLLDSKFVVFKETDFDVEIQTSFNWHKKSSNEPVSNEPLSNEPLSNDPPAEIMRVKIIESNKVKIQTDDNNTDIIVLDDSFYFSCPFQLCGATVNSNSFCMFIVFKALEPSCIISYQDVKLGVMEDRVYLKNSLYEHSLGTLKMLNKKILFCIKNGQTMHICREDKWTQTCMSSDRFIHIKYNPNNDSIILCPSGKVYLYYLLLNNGSLDDEAWNFYLEKAHSIVKPRKP